MGFPTTGTQEMASNISQFCAGGRHLQAPLVVDVYWAREGCPRMLPGWLPQLAGFGAGAGLGQHWLLLSGGLPGQCQFSCLLSQDLQWPYTNRTKPCPPNNCPLLSCLPSPCYPPPFPPLFLLFLLVILLLLSSCSSPSPPALEQLSLHTHSHQNQLWGPNPSTQQPHTQSEPRLSPETLLLSFFALLVPTVLPGCRGKCLQAGTGLFWPHLRRGSRVLPSWGSPRAV